MGMPVSGAASRDCWASRGVPSRPGSVESAEHRLRLAMAWGLIDERVVLASASVWRLCLRRLARGRASRELQALEDLAGYGRILDRCDEPHAGTAEGTQQSIYLEDTLKQRSPSHQACFVAWVDAGARHRLGLSPGRPAACRDSVSGQLCRSACPGPLRILATPPLLAHSTRRSLPSSGRRMVRWLRPERPGPLACAGSQDSVVANLIGAGRWGYAHFPSVFGPRSGVSGTPGIAPVRSGLRPRPSVRSASA